jgi:phosphatidylglycerol---prolipoprotein diacylglyceryl transferase
MLNIFRNIFAPPRDLILLVAATWIGVILAEKRVGRYQLTRAAFNNLVFYSLIAYLLGGRLFYAAAHFSSFLQSPVSFISLNITLFDNWGGLAAAVIIGFAFGQRAALQLRTTLDALTPVFALVAIGLGFSHLASGLAFGMQTTAAWGIQLWGATRYPTQLYEITSALIIFGLIWSRKTTVPPGSEFLLFVALTSGSRLFIEAFRGDSFLIPGGFRAAQIIAWASLCISLVGLELLGPHAVAASAPLPSTERKRGTKRHRLDTPKKKTKSAQEIKFVPRFPGSAHEFLRRRAIPGLQSAEITR